MSEWMSRLIAKHTCFICEKKLNKKEIYTVTMDTLEGPHSVTMCEEHAMEFDSILKDIEEVRKDAGTI